MEITCLRFYMPSTFLQSMQSLSKLHFVCLNIEEYAENMKVLVILLAPSKQFRLKYQPNIGTIPTFKYHEVAKAFPTIHLFYHNTQRRKSILILAQQLCQTAERISMYNYYCQNFQSTFLAIYFQGMKIPKLTTKRFLSTKLS